MTKDVLVTINGIHTMDEEDNDVEMVVRGDYYQKNGKHYILYEEVLEGMEETVKNVIKISDSSMDIIKKGAANSHMLFEKNKKNLSCYSTPWGYDSGYPGEPFSGRRREGQPKGPCGLFSGYQL